MLILRCKVNEDLTTNKTVMGRTHKENKMFVKINRFNEDNEVKELVVNTEEIAFLSETKPHVEESEDGETEIETPRYLIAWKNGKHPQFIDKENYEKLVSLLVK